MLRNGHDLPIGDLLGDPRDVGRTGAQRAADVFLLPRRWRQRYWRRRFRIWLSTMAGVTWSARPRSTTRSLLIRPHRCRLAGSSLCTRRNSMRRQRAPPTGRHRAAVAHGGDHAVLASVARALKNSLLLRASLPIGQGGGWHFLASMRPIPARNAADLVARMPPAAIVDLMEWGPATTPNERFDRVLATETHHRAADRPFAQYSRVAGRPSDQRVLPAA